MPKKQQDTNFFLGERCFSAKINSRIGQALLFQAAWIQRLEVFWHELAVLPD
jgi:hypothetical protein